jgi:hypothetical protein
MREFKLLCLCGCEKEVGPYSKKGYVNGHFNKGKDFSEEHRKKISEKAKERTGDKNPFYGKKHSEGTKKKLSVSIKKVLSQEEVRNKLKGRVRSKETLQKMSEVRKGKKLGSENPFFGRKHNNEVKKKISYINSYSIKKINKKYPFFSKIEEMRYNPDKPEEKEIQVHCKNHDCINSKEKGGWFTPTKSQLHERIRNLEKPLGTEGSYFYCSTKCKQECPLYGLVFDPYKKNTNPYIEEEYQTFRNFVLERDNYLCQFCGKKAEHVHHERPQKLEPFFALDPDFAWSCCKECHYKFGHKDECSTGNLAITICK